jgi:hypothetical protein
VTTREDVKYAEPELIESELMEPYLIEPVLMEPYLTEPELMEPYLIEPELTEPEMDRLLSTGRQPSGRIIHDERGNAVWKWFGDNSTIVSASPALANIDPLDLTVEGQDGGSGGGRAPAFDAGGGYDPYNQGAPRARTGIPKTGVRGKR